MGGGSLSCNLVNIPVMRHIESHKVPGVLRNRNLNTKSALTTVLVLHECVSRINVFLACSKENRMRLLVDGKMSHLQDIPGSRSSRPVSR